MTLEVGVFLLSVSLYGCYKEDVHKSIFSDKVLLTTTISKCTDGHTCCYPRESEGLCFSWRWFVCLSIRLSVCLLPR